MTKSASVAALLCAVVLSCDWYEKNTVQDISGPVPAGAKIKFFNFGVGSPGVNFYADSRKMTAVLSSTGRESPNGVTYGNAGDGGLYVAIAAGQYTLSGKIADTAAAVHNLAISNVTATLAADKAYSFYQSGIYDAVAKTVDGFVVEDNFAPQIDYSVAYVRFVHAVSNATAMRLFALSTTDTTQVVTVGDSVSYKGAGAFTAVPGGVYHLRARYSGGTNAITRNNVSFLAGRVYTIGARGNITVASTVALDNTANR